MNCYSSVPSTEEKFRRLVGPLKDVTKTELKFYELARPCQDQEELDTIAEFQISNKNKKELAIANEQIKNEITEKSFPATDGSVSVSSVCKESDISRTDSTTQNDKLFNTRTPLPPIIFQQSYTRWKSDMDMNFRLMRIKRKPRMCLVLLEDFPDFLTNFVCGDHQGFFELLRHFLSIYFQGFEVNMMPAINMEKSGWKINTRNHSVTQQKQYLVGDVNKSLNKNIPSEAYCIVGFTWTDLYPTEKLNFVLGEAHAYYRAATLSFGRFEPKLFQDGQVPPEITKVDAALIWKMLRAVSHEVCHIFGLAHCVYFDCAMNESSFVEEALSQPFDVCPVCLRKLQKVFKFDLVERFQGLLDFFENLDQIFPYPQFKQTIEWYKKCISFLS